MTAHDDQVLLLGPTAGGPAPRRSHWRLKVFLLTVALCLVVGLTWDFLRPPHYRVSASLLAGRAPVAGDEPALADPQNLAVQGQRLLGQPLLEEVARRLAAKAPGGGPVDAEGLRALFQVTAVPETNLLQLSAEGGDPRFLSLAVNTWIETYLEQRARDVAALEERTTRSLREEQARLKARIEAARRALERFRAEHRILSTDRDENQILARLKGLNESLNEAEAEKVKAKARLDAIEAALARGEAVVPDQDKRTYAALAERAQLLREQVAELRRNYTDKYIERSARLKAIPEQLARLEKQLRRMRARGRDHLLSEARQRYAAARQTVTELQAQLDRLKRQAQEFTARFAEYQAMEQDLEELQNLYRTQQDRLVKVEISNRRKFPHLQVVEWAFPPERPHRPRYWRDAALVGAGALGAGLFMVWLVGFLRPRSDSPAPVNMGIAIRAPGGREALEAPERAPTAALDRPPTPPALTREAGPLPTEAELARMLERADALGRQLMVLLLSGAQPEEIPGLDADDLDLQEGILTVGGKHPRRLRLPPKVLDWFSKDGHPWLAWSERGGIDREEIEARLQLAARLSGVEPGRIDAEALRRLYLQHLVRQGLRLSLLEELAGPMSARELLALGEQAPAEADRPLDRIDPIFPLFR